MVSQLVWPPAPLDGAELAESLRPFGQSRMLPRAAYTDPAVFDWERRHFFGSGWVCVCRSDQVAAPGALRAERAGAGSVLLARDEHGTLHAYPNTCRHRGHELLPCGASATGRVIICPYHAWTYGLDGQLRAARRADKMDTCDKSEVCLDQVQVEEFGGMVYVN